MSKKWTPRRETAPLSSARPSRIRREPPPPAPARKSLQTYPSEREAWVVAIGVILFALAITVITVGVSNYVN